jgi:hypothetical protein
MGHPLEENAGRAICDLLKFYPGNQTETNFRTEANFREPFLKSNMWDADEYEAGLACAESQGWVRRTRGRVTLISHPVTLDRTSWIG